MATGDKYIVSGLSTVLIFPIEGLNLTAKNSLAKIEEKVEKKLKGLVDQLKAQHAKFEDSDFGPTDKDEYGAISFYGNGKPDPAGSKYPAPDTLKWERPQYADDKFANASGAQVATSGDDTASEGEEDDEYDEEEDEDDFGICISNNDAKIWCKKGKLFVDGSSSGDVIQGQLGDCWFLSALAVLGAKDSLLERCFYRANDFQEHGLFILRFFKDCNVIYVIIDDRLPVKAKDGRLIFAANKDPNELWVPLIEKAYAKLHGCYKSLIGGYTHYGLADMTGFCPRLVVMREGYVGYSEAYSDEDVWNLLRRYQAWGCLMGCSIQSNPKEKNKVEADAGQGLHYGHAYSFLGIGEVAVDPSLAPGGKLRLVKLRNPWGRGEWEGAFSDRSDERAKYTAQIEDAFNRGERQQERVEQNFNDGTFLMPFADWRRHFTSLFVAINFPPTWCGKRVQGSWSSEQGGNRDMGTWITNPKFKFKLEPSGGAAAGEFRQVFVGIYIKDSRLTLGYDYYKDPLYATPLTFDIVTEAELRAADAKLREFIPAGCRMARPSGASALTDADRVKQPPYNFGTTQVEVYLQVGVEYYIVPSLYKRHQAGTFFLNVFADVPSFFLEGSSTMSEAQMPMVVGPAAAIPLVVPAKPAGAASAPPSAAPANEEVVLKMSVAQFYERKEALRERILSEAQRLNLSVNQLQAIFKDCRDRMTHSAFKRRMMEVGFMLTDFPDDDLVVLDKDNDGTISPQEFMVFYEEGLKFSDVTVAGDVPEPPVDDLLLKSIDLSGELAVKVYSARSVRQPTSWFGLAAEKAVADADPGIISRAVGAIVRYDPQEAAALRVKAKQARLAKASATPVLTLAAPTGDQSAAPPSPGGLDGSALAKSLLTSSNRFTPSKSGVLGGLREALVSERGVGSVVSGISLSQREAVQQAGAAAAAKLHTDPLLKKAELSRTKHLPMLRSYAQKQREIAGAAASEEGSASPAFHGVLRKKTVGWLPQKRPISDDLEMQRLLNCPAPSSLPVAIDGTASPSLRVSTPGPPLSATKVASIRMSKQFSMPFFSGATAGDQSALPPTLSPASAVAPRATSSALANMMPVDKHFDLWDHLIDCVVTISTARPSSRNAERQLLFSKMRRQPLSAKALTALNVVKSPLPAPSMSRTPNKVSKGTVATPKTMRRVTGVASVNTAQSKTQQKNTVLEAKDRLAQLQREQGASYEEVYRRLVSVPVTSYEEISGERNARNTSLSQRSTVYIASLFQRFDRNLNGYISKDEFRVALGEVNVEVSAEDCDIFFNRFRAKTPGNIAWQDFLEFFETHIAGGTNAVAQSTALPAQSLVTLVAQMRTVLQNVLLEMISADVKSVEKLLEKHATNRDPATNRDAAAVTAVERSPRSNALSIASSRFPDNAIFQSLELSQVKNNVALMHSLGMGELCVNDMARVSRVFDHKVSLLMEFLRAPAVDLVEALDVFDVELNKELSMRSGMPLATRLPAPAASGPSTAPVAPSALTAKASSSSTPPAAGPKLDLQIAPAPPPTPSAAGADGLVSVAATTKIWNSLAPDVSSTIAYDAFVKYLGTLLSVTTAPTQAAPRAPAVKDATPFVASAPHIMGVNTEVLTRLVADALVYSTWNRGTWGRKETDAKSAQDSSQLVSALSFSGLDAYMRANRVNFIERKLKYLMQLESNISSPAVNLLVHAFVSTQGDELVVLANDPLTAEVFKVHVKEDVRALPFGEKLKALVADGKDWEREARRLGGPAASRIFNSESLYLYNPVDTPAEDRAITGVVSRLKIVRTRTNESEMILSEDPKFVAQLRALLDGAGAALPFFFLVNELNLCFEVDEEQLKAKDPTGKAQSLRSFVFSSLRAHKALHSFLTQVRSSLKVVLSTYNGTSRETFDWEEMLAHLTNHRNPFVTAQLLPKYISPERYLYEPQESTQAFTGDADSADEEDGVADGGGEGSEGRRVRRRSWQRSLTDRDGAPHPSWDHQFGFDFAAPKLASCTVLCTEVVKMRVDDTWKYVMVIVRQGTRRKMTFAGTSATEKEPFHFLTIYDPRSATEFQCGVLPGCPLYRRLYYHKFSDGHRPEAFDAKDLLALVGAAGEQHMLLLGPAITPRLEIQVYNHKDDKLKELLGQCQVSISAVLSGSGVGDKTWVTLIHKADKPQEPGGTSAAVVSSKTVDLNAGEIQIELAFRRSIESAAEQKAAEARGAEARTKGRTKSAGQAPGRGDEGFASDVGQVMRVTQQEKEGERFKDLEKKYAVLQGELQKMKSAPVPNAVPIPTSADPEKERLAKEREQALALAAQAQKEKAALEEQLRRLRDEGARKSAPVPAPTAAAPNDEATKLQKELVDLRRQFEQLKSSEAEARKQLQQALQTQAPTPAAAPAAAPAVVVTQPAELKSVAASVPMAASAPVPTPVGSVPATLEDDEMVRLPRGNYNEAMVLLLQTLWARYERRRNRPDSKPASALASLSSLLIGCANIEGLVSHKDVIHSCAELLIDIDTETAVRLLHEVGPNQRQLVQVHAVMDFLTRELAQMVKVSKKGGLAAAPAVEPLTENAPAIADEAYAAALQRLLAVFQARFERRGKALNASVQASAPFDGLLRLLRSVASPEGLVSFRDLAGACSELLVPLEDRVAARIVHESTASRAKQVKSSAVVDYLTRELSSQLRAQQKALGASQPPSQRSSSPSPARAAAAPAPQAQSQSPALADSKRGESTGRVRPASANPTPATRTAPGPSKAPAVSRDDTAGTSKGRTLSDLRHSRDGPLAVVDWASEPLPPNWERRFHGPTQRYVYINHEAKKTQWHHPLDPFKASDLSKTDGKGRVAAMADSKPAPKEQLLRTAPASVMKAVVRSDEDVADEER